MGELAGWERPNWYVVNARYEYTYGKPNWFEACQRECDALANDVALFDQSSYPIFHVSGAEALHCLQYICANDVNVPWQNRLYPVVKSRWRYRGRRHHHPHRSQRVHGRQCLRQ